jgi:predicted  nucleic acid-binding Zn-ribbon protein
MSIAFKNICCAALALLIAGILPADAAEPTSPAPKATVKDISRQASETGQTIRNYTVEQRDEAVKSARKALDDADSRIHRLEKKIDAEWDDMDQAARRKARAALDALRRERNNLAEWFGGLKHSSREAWEEVKGGFVKSYDALKESFSRAAKHF